MIWSDVFVCERNAFGACENVAVTNPPIKPNNACIEAIISMESHKVTKAVNVYFKTFN